MVSIALTCLKLCRRMRDGNFEHIVDGSSNTAIGLCARGIQ
jgi:hypothetical protein